MGHLFYHLIAIFCRILPIQADNIFLVDRLMQLFCRPLLTENLVCCLVSKLISSKCKPENIIFYKNTKHETLFNICGVFWHHKNCKVMLIFYPIEWNFDPDQESENMLMYNYGFICR